MKTTVKTAIIYLRVSTDEQTESGLGLEAQEATARKWCQTNGFDVGLVCRDEGVSGTVPVDKRPELTKALASLRRGGVLVAARRDRFARSIAIAAVIEETARRRGARVVTPDAPESDDPFAGAMRGMMDVFSQLERALIASRTRGALAAKRARGEKTGGSLPVGFDLGEDGKKLVVNDTESSAIAMVRKLRAEGLSVRAIAETLNAEGVPARGDKWHSTTIARLLKRTG